MNNSVKPGDLWLVLGNVAREPCVFYLINEVQKFSGVGASVFVDSFTSGVEEAELDLNVHTYVHTENDRKITDPAEKAYWLLRMENARNKV